MEVVHQPGRTMGLADYIWRHLSDYNEKEWSKNSKELWESLFMVFHIEKQSEKHTSELENQNANTLFYQTI